MIEIIPATDIIGGQCVRLTQGDYASRKTYYRDPLEAAFRFEEAALPFCGQGCCPSSPVTP